MYNDLISIFLLLFAVVGCKNPENSTTKTSSQMDLQNILANINHGHLGNLAWLNEPKSFLLENGTLQVVAGKGTDFFNNPVDGTIHSSAPFLYQNIRGDFVATALVRPDFTSMWNATALMVLIDSVHWIKFAFENSDATGNSIVSVVTKGVSDDANGVMLSDQNEAWLKLIRKGDNYSMFWSKDGRNFKMARLCAMPAADPVKLGMEFQCPVGESAKHEITYFGLSATTVNDLRKGE